MQQKAQTGHCPKNILIGMGVSANTDSSSSEKCNAQVDATVAAVVVDGEGKVVACRIDCAQNKMDVTGGAVDTAKEFLTKDELGDDYNMVKFSDATLEWNVQAANFAEYCVGKTADEISGTETVVNDEGHTVFVDETLYATCSISIDDFVDAVVKAINDEKGMSFAADGAFKLGVAAISTADESTAATADAEGSVKMYTEFAAAVVDENGVILASVNDAIQPKIAIDANGAITGSDFKGTKRELGADYGMVAFGNAVAEWDAQSMSFAQYTVGKTADEVRTLDTVVNEEGHQVTTDETLFAECTMSIGGMMEVTAKAADNAF